MNNFIAERVEISLPETYIVFIAKLYFGACAMQQCQISITTTFSGTHSNDEPLELEPKKDQEVSSYYNVESIIIIIVPL